MKCIGKKFGICEGRWWLAVAVAVLCSFLAFHVCGANTVEQNMAEQRKEHIIPGKETHLTKMRGYRFCEVALIVGTSKENAVANFYNTTGLSDPTPEQFAALNADEIAKETKSLRVWLNLVRHWMFDEFWVWELGDEKRFGDIKATWMGVVPLQDMEKAVIHPSFFPGYIYRASKFKFNKGSEVYLLDAPDGEVFVMQSYTSHYDKSLTEAGLKDLGSKLKLPAGWKFRTKVLDKDLVVSQEKSKGLAHVLQDTFHNTYQGSDGGKAFNYIP